MLTSWHFCLDSYEPVAKPSPSRPVDEPLAPPSDRFQKKKQAEEEERELAMRKEIEEQKRKMIEKTRAPVAARNVVTLGEDYDDDVVEEKPQTRSSRGVVQEPVRRPFGQSNLPTFEELMKSTDVDKKGFESDED